MKYLAVLLSSAMLVACGGGGSDGSDGSAASSALDASGAPASTSSAVSPANAALAKYEGVWRQDCIDHMRLTATFTATSANIFTVTPKEEHFANADCTGAVVATGSFGQPQETVQYAATLANASVKLLTGETIEASVDPATSISAVASFTFTGSGVTSTYNVAGQTLTYIVYADGFATILRAAVNGETTHGALLLRNGELLALVPIGDSTTSFQVNRRYIR